MSLKSIISMFLAKGAGKDYCDTCIAFKLLFHSEVPIILADVRMIIQSLSEHEHYHHSFSPCSVCETVKGVLRFQTSL